VTRTATKAEANKWSSGPWLGSNREWAHDAIYLAMTSECVVWATMKAQRRTNDNIDLITAVTIDFDDPVGEAKPWAHMKQVRSHLATLGVNYAIKTTHHHQKSKKGVVCDRFRVLLPLSSPIPSQDFKVIKQWAMSLFPESDSSAFVVSRYWFRCPDDGIYSFFGDGNYLDWTTLPSATSSATSVPTPPTRTIGAPAKGEFSDCTTERKQVPLGFKVKLADGKWTTVGDLQQAGKHVQIHCPNSQHEDRNPSAFANVTSSGKLYLSCTVCEDELKDNTSSRSWWADTSSEVDVIEEWNSRYAQIMHGGRACVLSEEANGDFSLAKAGEFHDFKSHIRIEHAAPNGQVKTVPASKIWYQHPRVRLYDKLVVKPDSDYVRRNEYNAWRGYGVSRVDDESISIEPILDHIRNIICAGNEEHYVWLMSWIAQMYQAPTEKPGTAIMLYGMQGCGKTIISELLQKLWHRNHVVPANTPQQFLGRFNSHLEYAILIACEEAVWAGSSKDTDRLKDIITGKRLMLEPKGRDMLYCKNNLRIFGTTNREFSVPAGIGERRWFVIDCDNKYADCVNDPGRVGYFKSLFKLIDDKRVLGRFLDFVLKYDYSSVNLTSAPKTEALARSQSHNLDPVPRWVYDCLASHSFVGGEFSGWPGQVSTTDLYDAFLNYANKAKLRYPGSLVTFGKVIRQYGFIKKRCMHNGDRGYVYTVPPFDVTLREYFKAIGSAIPADMLESKNDKGNVFSLVSSEELGESESSKKTSSGFDF